MQEVSNVTLPEVESINTSYVFVGTTPLSHVPVADQLPPAGTGVVVKYIPETFEVINFPFFANHFAPPVQFKSFVFM
jgi:hypothetical protein